MVSCPRDPRSLSMLCCTGPYDTSMWTSTRIHNDMRTTLPRRRATGASRRREHGPYFTKISCRCPQTKRWRERKKGPIYECIKHSIIYRLQIIKMLVSRKMVRVRVHEMQQWVNEALECSCARDATRLADAESCARDATMTLRQTAEMLQLHHPYTNGIIDW